MPERIIETVLSDDELLEWENRRVVSGIMNKLESNEQYQEIPQVERNKIRKAILDEINAFYRLSLKLLEKSRNGSGTV